MPSFTPSIVHLLALPPGLQLVSSNLSILPRYIHFPSSAVMNHLACLAGFISKTSNMLLSPPCDVLMPDLLHPVHSQREASKLNTSSSVSSLSPNRHCV